MQRPPSPKYTAYDILNPESDNAYPGGLKAYRHNRHEHLVYALWHMWRTKGRCSKCNRFVIANFHKIEVGEFNGV